MPKAEHSPARAVITGHRDPGTITDDHLHPQGRPPQSSSRGPQSASLCCLHPHVPLAAPEVPPDRPARQMPAPLRLGACDAASASARRRPGCHHVASSTCTLWFLFARPDSADVESLPLYKHPHYNTPPHIQTVSWPDILVPRYGSAYRISLL